MGYFAKLSGTVHSSSSLGIQIRATDNNQRLMHVSVAYTPSLPVISAAFRFGSVVDILRALAKKEAKE